MVTSPTSLAVDLGSALPELQQHLAGCASVVECCFETKDLVQTGRMKEASWGQLLERMVLVGESLPNLEKIAFDWTISELIGSSFPVRSMAELLKLQQDTLKSLSLRQWGSTIAGTTDDFEHFFRFLSQCQQLQEFLIDWDCQFEVTDYQESKQGRTGAEWVADSILRALSTIKSLEDVTFLAARNYSAKALKTFCGAGMERMSLHLANCSLSTDLVDAMVGESSCLAALHLEDIRHIGSHAEQLRALIWHHPSLRKFSFDGRVGPAATLVEGLDEHVKLEELCMEVWCDGETTADFNLPPLHDVPLQKLALEVWDMDPKATQVMATSLAQGVAANQWLEEVSLEFNFDDDISDSRKRKIKDTQMKLCSNLGDGLAENNSTLKEFNISFGEGCDPFARFDRCLAPSDDRLKFWLDLNRLERGTLLGQPQDQKLWNQTLLDRRSDTSVAYWLLSTNPELLLAC